MDIQVNRRGRDGTAIRCERPDKSRGDFWEESIFNAVDLVASAVRGGRESRIRLVADLPRFES
jgi:hypothetical protein